MGCGASKVDSDVLKLCRERKICVKDARDSWCSFASMHLGYFESILGFQNQLKSFMGESITFCFDPVSTIGADNQIHEDPQSGKPIVDCENNEENGGEDSEDDNANTSSPEPQLQRKSRKAGLLGNSSIPHYNNGNSNRFSAHKVQTTHSSANCGVIDDMNLRYVREKEGIPPLEDHFGNLVEDDEEVDLSDDLEDLSSESSIEVFIPEENTANRGQDAYPGQIENIQIANNIVENVESIQQQEVELKEIVEEGPDLNKIHSSGPSEELRSSTINGLTNIKNRVQNGVRKDQEGNSSSVNKNLTAEGMKKSEMCDQEKEFRLNMPACSSLDLQEMLNKINNAFAEVIMHGKDVSMMFGPHQPIIAFAAASSRVMSRLENVSNGTDNHLSEADIDRCSLLVTLEKLCLLESKLYKEVKVEEKLGDKYDNDWRRLQSLYNKGAESSKIDSVLLSLKKWTPKMVVAISVIEGIAKTTHGIRDEELYPLICELISRLHKMWLKLSEAHKNQVCAIIEAQTNAHIMCKNDDACLGAIQNLESQIKKLGNAFSDWIKIHRAFANFMKTWLTKFVPPGSTSNLSSPSSLEVLTICHSWSTAAGEVSEALVLDCLNNLSGLLHLLQLKLNEERGQRLQMEHLSNFHEGELAKVSNDSSVDWAEYVSFVPQSEDQASISESKFSSLHACYLSLEPVRIKLRDAKARNEVAGEELKALPSDVIQRGFIPLLEALQSFCSKMQKSLELNPLVSTGQ